MDPHEENNNNMEEHQEENKNVNMEEEEEEEEEENKDLQLWHQCALNLLYMSEKPVDVESLRRLISMHIQLGCYPPIPSLMGRVGQCSPCFRKILTTSDVNGGESRFLIHKEFAVSRINILLDETEDPATGIECTMYDHMGMEYSMVYKLWTNKLFVLTKGWKSYFQDHNLEANKHEICLWAFRHIRRPLGLFFAVTYQRVNGVVTPERKGNNKKSGKNKNRGACMAYCF